MRNLENVIPSARFCKIYFVDGKGREGYYVTDKLLDKVKDKDEVEIRFVVELEDGQIIGSTAEENFVHRCTEARDETAYYPSEPGSTKHYPASVSYERVEKK